MCPRGPCLVCSEGPHSDPVAAAAAPLLEWGLCHKPVQGTESLHQKIHTIFSQCHRLRRSSWSGWNGCYVTSLKMMLDTNVTVHKGAGGSGWVLLCHQGKSTGYEKVSRNFGVCRVVFIFVVGLDISNGGGYIGQCYWSQIIEMKMCDHISVYIL